MVSHESVESLRASAECQLRLLNIIKLSLRFL